MKHRDQKFRSLEFTYRWYRDFLERLQEAGYDVRAFGDAPGPGDVILHHDVTLSVEKAMHMARIETDLGVEACYCIQVTSPLYNPLESRWRDTIRAIDVLGHEVGLQFSTHEYWGGTDRPEDDIVEHRVADERAVLNTVTSRPPETVSFRVPPDWVLDRSFDGFRNAYAPPHFSEIAFLSDSGQRWRYNPPDFEEFSEGAHVLVHPGLWGETDDTFVDRVGEAIADARSHTEEKIRREFLEGQGD